jgi:hypothetical protein
VYVVLLVPIQKLCTCSFYWLSGEINFSSTLDIQESTLFYWLKQFWSLKPNNWFRIKVLGVFLNCRSALKSAEVGEIGGGGTTFSLASTSVILDAGCSWTTLHTDQWTEWLR